MLVFNLGSYKHVVAQRNKYRPRRRKKFWIRPGRTSLWWDNIWKNKTVDEEWHENFRMSRDNFLKLCQQLRPFLIKQVTRFRKPIEVEKQLAITLYYLADEGRFRKVSNAFGVAKSTVSVIVRRVCEVITTVLGPEYSTLNYHKQIKKFKRQSKTFIQSMVSHSV